MHGADYGWWGIVNPQAMAKALAAASLVDAMDQLETQRQAIKDGTFRPPRRSSDTGKHAVGAYDAATLKQVGNAWRPVARRWTTSLNVSVRRHR